MRIAVTLLPAAVLALVLSSAVPVRAELSDISFDQGVDLSRVMSEVREKAKEMKTENIAVKPLFTRTERDCVNFTLGPNDPPQTEAVWLRSTEWIEECYPDDPRPPRYPRDIHPRARKSDRVDAKRNCYERPGRTYRERVQVAIRDRQPLLPWEYDRFEVCLDGPWLNLYDSETAYEYKTVQGGSSNGSYVLAPVRKIRMNPDPAGIAARSFTPQMVFTAQDRWTSYYAGEKTVLVLKLRRYHKNWFDATILTKEFSFDSAESYQVDFMAYAGEFAGKLQAGKKYYVEYSFKRISAISKDKLMKVGDSMKAGYQPASAAVGR